MEFKRTKTEELLLWSKKPKRKPLVLLGARQVGKTSLLKHFGQKYFKDYIYINFELSQQYHQLFEEDLDPHGIVAQIGLLQGKKIDPEHCLIIFDEIQECGRALTALKYFNENAPEYSVVAAGSLLGLTLGKTRSFPVGQVDFMYLYPLTFEEFVNGESEKVSKIYNYGLEQKINPVNQPFHDLLIDAFKRYTISGGMPEAARAMAGGASNEEVGEILRIIDQSYKLDFAKHAPSAVESARIQYVWDAIPSQLSKENKKFMYRTIRSGARAREYEVALTWLEQAGLIYKIYKTEKPYYPLSAYDDISAFKLYVVDQGILSRRAELEHYQILDPDKIFREFKGALAENYICQALIPQFKAKPRYWKSAGTAEVDFVIQYKREVIPIEVKSNISSKHKSLSTYTTKYAPKLRVRISLNNLKLDGGLLNIPIYYGDRIKHWVDKALGGMSV